MQDVFSKDVPLLAGGYRLLTEKKGSGGTRGTDRLPTTANYRRRAVERKWKEVKLEKLQVPAKGVTRWMGMGMGRAGTVMAAPRPPRVNFIEHVGGGYNTPVNWQTLQASS